MKVFWNEPFDISNLNLFNQVDVSAVKLTVPSGTKALYQAALVWQDFGMIAEQNFVEVTSNEPAGVDGEGTIHLALEIPTNTLFTGSFYIQLPEGFTLNTEKTRLVKALAALLDWTITQEEGNKWLITISLRSLRQTKNDVTYTQIMEIVYNVEESIEDGTYEVIINDLDFEFEDGTFIREVEIPVEVPVDHSYVGITAIQSGIHVYIAGNQLYVNTPQQEMIYLYSVSGQLKYSGMKAEGMTVISLGEKNNQLLIIRGGSGWVRKAARN